MTATKFSKIMKSFVSRSKERTIIAGMVTHIATEWINPYRMPKIFDV